MLRVFHKILVPVDFSSPSLHAMNYAAIIASKFSSEIILFHVNEVPAVMNGESPVVMDYNSISSGIREELHHLEESLRTSYNLTKIKTLTIPGFALDEIRSEAVKESVDLIVMGTSSAADHDILTSSLSDRVLHKATCPVLVIPEDSALTLPNNIYFAFETDEDITHVIPILSSVSESLQISLSINESGYSSDAKSLKDKWRTLSHNNSTTFVTSTKSVREVLTAYAQSVQPAWISSLVRNKNFFASLFQRNFERELALRSKFPFLAFHAV